MSREAVLLQWERKIEAAERLDGDSRRFVRTPQAEAAPAPLQLAEDGPEVDATAPAPRRFERAQPVERQSVAERRTVTITGQPTPTRRRRPLMDAELAQPDRIALWAFLLGLLLVAVAAGTAHA